MGLWSAFRPELVAAPPPPPISTLTLMSEFSLVPLQKAMIRYLGVHGNAGLRGILCVCRDTHEYSRTELYFHNLSGALGAGVVVGWWRWAWGWHVSANNHITHRDPHSNFLIPSPPPPTNSASLGYLLPPSTGLGGTVQAWARPQQSVLRI